MTGARLGRWAGPLAVAALCTASFLAGPVALHALRYDRAAIAHGQWWRLVGCSVVHLNGWHLVQDLLGLALLVSLMPRPWSATGWLMRLVWTSVAMSALLWCGWPRIGTYAGLSGPLYGVCVMALLPAARQGDRLAAAALLALAAGIAAELALGSPAAEERLIGGHVAAESHLAGAVAGLAWLAGLAAWRRGALAGSPVAERR